MKNSRWIGIVILAVAVVGGGITYAALPQPTAAFAQPVVPTQIDLPYAGQIQVQTTATSIYTAYGARTISLFNYGTSPVCCVWTQPDAGGLVTPDGGALPGPSTTGPAPCVLDVQASGTGTQIPGTAVYNVTNNKTISCISAVAQSTDGGDLRFYQE